MKNLIYLLLIFTAFFFSSASYALTYSSINITDISRSSHSTPTDLNDSKIECETYANSITTNTPGCLWFAEGDVIQFYNPVQDLVALTTVTTSNAGWYALYPINNPTTGIDDPFRDDWPVYNNLYSDLFFDITQSTHYFRKFLLDSNGLTDYVGTYQGFRDIANCDLLTVNDPPYSDSPLAQLLPLSVNSYSGSDYFQTNYRDETGAVATYTTNKTHCTTPTQYGGLSCSIDTTINFYQADTLYYNLIAEPSMSANCSDFTQAIHTDTQTIFSFVVPALTNPVLPDFILNSTPVEMLSDLTPLTTNGVFIPEKFVSLHFDGIEHSTPVDSDSDGIIDTNDAFPNDATNGGDACYSGIDGTYDAGCSVDTDGDGIIDSNDAYPSDSTNGGDTGYSGIDGTYTPPVGDTSGDTSDPVPDYSNTTGTASGSCATAPTCSAETAECLLVHQVWQSGCMNKDTSEPLNLTLTDNTYSSIGLSFSDRVAATAFVSGFSNFSNAVNLSAAICPAFSITLPWPISDTVSTDQHCALFSSISSYLTTVMLVVYTFTGFRIVASA